MLERTLSIIKPDAVSDGLTGKILAKLESEGLKIIALRKMHLMRKQAEGFYAVHKERPFFDSLVEFMTSGPVVVSVLEADNAIQRYRTVMGATDPAQAEDETIRKLYGSNIQNNAVHGSDGPDTARTEIGYFFSELELTG